MAALVQALYRSIWWGDRAASSYYGNRGVKQTLWQQSCIRVNATCVGVRIYTRACVWRVRLVATVRKVNSRCVNIQLQVLKKLYFILWGWQTSKSNMYSTIWRPVQKRRQSKNDSILPIKSIQLILDLRFISFDLHPGALEGDYFYKKIMETEQRWRKKNVTAET